MASINGENRAAPQREEVSFQNKYGGISPKKPLISKDHERAYFDSADWVLGKQGASNNGTKVPAAEPLKPKLQRTAYHQLPPRRPACTSGGTE
uniref:cAMP-regulated phosphoprotein 19-related protein n=1 Tax=Arundo donax TaxID=35708 RepID=A0A0A9AW81_ARUDO